MHPEDNFTYAMSHFAIPINPESPLESMRLLLQTIEELQSGTPFFEVARSRSGNAPDSAPSMWMGFMRPQQPDPVTGAYQAVQFGEYGGPVQHEQAAHFFYRHTFEEGRQIEAQEVIPAYGFFLPRDSDDPNFSEEEFERGAKEALEKVRRGELTLAEASEKYGSSTTRADAFIDNVRDGGRKAELYRILEHVAPGELAPLSRVPGAGLIVRRGVYFRSHVRHILIQHIDSANRPLTVSRTKDDAKALAEKILTELHDGSLTWSEAIHRHSDDVQTAALLGWIGAVSNGDLVPQFEAAILGIEPGHIGDELVELNDGFHILYRVN